MQCPPRRASARPPRGPWCTPPWPCWGWTFCSRRPCSACEQPEDGRPDRRGGWNDLEEGRERDMTSRGIESSVGLFMLAGCLALAMLALRVGRLTPASRRKAYTLDATVDNECGPPVV